MSLPPWRKIVLSDLNRKVIARLPIRVVSNRPLASSSRVRDDDASASTTSSVVEVEDGRVSVSTTSGRRRQRHRFHVDNIPSFQEFQQQQRGRSLYRQYLRVIWPNPQRHDLLRQVKYEFRQTSETAKYDEWQTKRALSEGSRRLKELSAMLGNSWKSDEALDRDDTEGHQPATQQAKTPPPSTSTKWPWQRHAEIDNPKHTRPVPFPPKTL